ncbi:inactive TPR repeat-containing thioredoxin TTL3, partial [Tanacetum coccineum]
QLVVVLVIILPEGCVGRMPTSVLRDWLFFSPNRVPHDRRGLASSGLFRIAHGEYFRRTQLFPGPTDGANFMIKELSLLNLQEKAVKGEEKAVKYRMSENLKGRREGISIEKLLLDVDLPAVVTAWLTVAKVTRSNVVSFPILMSYHTHVPIALSTRMDPKKLKIMGNEVYKSRKFVEALSLYDATIFLDHKNASYRSNEIAALTSLGRLLEIVFEVREAIRI